MVEKSAEWQDLLLIVEEEVAKVTEGSEVALDFEKLLVNIKGRLENAKILPLSVPMVRDIYEDLIEKYSVSQLEIGDDKTTELLLKQLKEILTQTDKSFLKDHSLYSVVTKPWHGEPVLVVLKNKQRIPVEDLKKVFFAQGDAGFCTKHMAYDVFKAGEDSYLIIYSNSFSIAIEAVSELIQKEESEQMRDHWRRLGKSLAALQKEEKTE